MGTIRVIAPNGGQSDLGYEGREPPLEMLQRAVGGYVEHLVVEHEGKRCSAYVNEEARVARTAPLAQRILAGGVTVTPNVDLNQKASRLAGKPILGPMVIDLGRSK